MAADDLSARLSQLETASETPQSRSKAFNDILESILKPASGSIDSGALVRYVQSIISDNIGVLHSRPLLSTFVEAYGAIEDIDVKLESGPEIIQLLAPRTVSYEQQDTQLKLILADAYEAHEDFTSSAKTLQAITLDSSQRAISADDRAKVWMRICRCYLEEEDPTNALTYLNRVKQIIFDVTDHITRLQFQLSQARISDSQRSFLDASTAYLALSNEAEIDEEERLQTLSAAITCAVLAPAGPPRARQLGKLYKDDRASQTAEYGILEKIFLDRLLSPAEVATFAAGLKDHQLAKTSDGSTVLDKAVLEHNLLAVSRLYQNIALSNLGPLLGVDTDRAETYAAGMIESDRLAGSIDQIEGTLYFHAKEATGNAAQASLQAWDQNVLDLAEEVERVATMLQRDEPAWYEAHVNA